MDPNTPRVDPNSPRIDPNSPYSKIKDHWSISKTFLVTLIAEVGEHGGDRKSQEVKNQGAIGTLKKKTHGTNQADRLLGVLKRDYANGKLRPANRLVKELNSPKMVKRQRKAAKAAKTNRQYVAVAKKLHSDAPELHAKMERKELTIVQAQREFREHKREERRAENAVNALY